MGRDGASDLPELNAHKVSKSVKRDSKRALKKKRVPTWALAITTPEELKQTMGAEE